MDFAFGCSIKRFITLFRLFVVVQFFVSLKFEINPVDKEEHKLHKVNDAVCYYFHLIYFVIFLESWN